MRVGADVNQSFTKGVTPLFLASQNGFIEIVKLLMDSHANPDLVFSSNKTDLLKFVENKSETVRKNMIEYIARHQSVMDDIKSFFKKESVITITPLEIARIMGHKEIVDEFNKRIPIQAKPNKV